MTAAWVANASGEPTIFGIALSPGASVDGKTLTADAIEKAAHDFMFSGNIRKSEHQVISSMVSPADCVMLDDQGRSHPVPRGAWVIGVKADDPDLVRRARSG